MKEPVQFGCYMWTYILCVCRSSAKWKSRGGEGSSSLLMPRNIVTSHKWRKSSEKSFVFIIHVSIKVSSKFLSNVWKRKCKLRVFSSTDTLSRLRIKHLWVTSSVSPGQQDVADVFVFTWWAVVRFFYLLIDFLSVIFTPLCLDLEARDTTYSPCTLTSDPWPCPSFLVCSR